MAGSASKSPMPPALPSRRPPPPLPPRAASRQLSPIPSPSTYQNPYPDAPPSYDSLAYSPPLSPSPTKARPPPTPIPQGSKSGNMHRNEDPRSSSTQSLVPTESNQQYSSTNGDRRRLLLIYIHGFMGDTTSFHSFPAHVHHLLTATLSDTHVVHTKLYPRYRSKRNISFARDDFGKWLEPHEDPLTDVVLLGHSMGGLLSAEVVLKSPPPPASRPLEHRILGTINFDVPFLGMHPGVIMAGLGSIFAPAPEEPTSPQPGASLPAEENPLWQQQDLNFNTPWGNDVNLPVRQGWQKAWHFVHKHSNELGKATKQLVTSHMEFGGAMADYQGLKQRYARTRMLEEVNERARGSVFGDVEHVPRVRFVNFYTASTGRPKKTKTPEGGSSLAGSASTSKQSLAIPDALDDQRLARALRQDGVVSAGRASASRMRSPEIWLEEQGDDGIVVRREPELHDVSEDDEDYDVRGAGLGMAELDPRPVSESEAFSEEDDWADAAEDVKAHHLNEELADGKVRGEEKSIMVAMSTEAPAGAALDFDEAGPSSPKSLKHQDSATASTLSTSTSLSLTASLSNLPPVPEPPTAPRPLDVSYIIDKETRNLVEKEHARAVKAYSTAVKDREKIIKDREKLEAKMRQRAEKDAERGQKDEEKARGKAEQQAEKERKKAAQKVDRDSAKERENMNRDRREQLQDAWELERREMDKAKRYLEGDEAESDLGERGEPSMRSKKEPERRGNASRLAHKPESEMTHSEREHLRLETERLRMEAEGRRMRGESEPELEGAQSSKAGDSSLSQMTAGTTTAGHDTAISPSAAAPSFSTRQSCQAAESLRRYSSHNSQTTQGTHKSEAPSKPAKDRKFCTLPPKDSAGQCDPCWFRVFMKDMDEVGAHCGLFIQGKPHYERFVSDVAERVEGWVREAGVGR